MNLHNLACIFLVFLIIHVSDKISFYFNEVFVNEVDGQL